MTVGEGDEPDLAGVKHLSLLTRAKNAAFDSDSLRLWFAEAIDQAELPEECVLHGLRKTAARMLAEAGCSVREIMSVTGHKSISEVPNVTPLRLPNTNQRVEYTMDFSAHALTIC